MQKIQVWDLPTRVFHWLLFLGVLVALVTGEDGRATVKLTLPDNLTTWRAVVRGASATALVGEGRARIVSTRPILVRVDAPARLAIDFLVKPAR